MRSRADNGSPRRAPRVWLVNHYADAPDRANGTRHFDLGRRLHEAGLDVTIIASGFSHVTRREERLGQGRLYRIERFDGVRFVWLRTLPYHGNTWRRQLNMLSFAAVLLVVQTRLRTPDVVIGSTVHPFAALAAWLVARIRRAAFLFEVRDLWPQTLVDLGALREGSAGERLLRSIEAFLVRRAAVVITLLPGMVDYLLERGLPVDHVRYVPNGVDLEALDRRGAAREDPTGRDPDGARATLAAIDRLRDDGRLVLAYVGALGRVNDVATIVEAAALAEARLPGRIGVVIIGDGPERARVELLARDVTAVVLAGAVPKRDVPLVLAAVDGGIVHATRNPVYRYGISFNKLFEYLAARRPVVFACESAYDPVALTGAGISLPPDDPARLASAFLDLASRSPDERARMGAAGRALVERDHDIRRLAGTLLAAIDAASGRPGQP